MDQRSHHNASNGTPPASGELFDELLVVMAQRGDRRALERLFHRWNSRLIRAAKRYCGDHDAARDLAQECWLAIWKGIGSLREPSRFRSFAFAILHRRGADHLGQTIRQRKTLAAASQSQALQAPSAPAAQSQTLALQQAFDALSPEHRLAAHLFFAEGLTLREIAEVQSIPEGTAKSRLFHARRQLKAALNQHSEGELR